MNLWESSSQVIQPGTLCLRKRSCTLFVSTRTKASGGRRDWSIQVIEKDPGRTTQDGRKGICPCSRYVYRFATGTGHASKDSRFCANSCQSCSRVTHAGAIHTASAKWRRFNSTGERGNGFVEEAWLADWAGWDGDQNQRQFGPLLTISPPIPRSFWRDMCSMVECVARRLT